MEKRLKIWFGIIAFLIIVLGSIGGSLLGILLLLISFVYPPFGRDFLAEARNIQPRKQFFTRLTFLLALWAVFATLVADPKSLVAWSTVLRLIMVIFPVFFAGVYAQKLDPKFLWRCFILGACLATLYIFYDYYIVGHHRAELLLGCNAAGTLLLGSVGVFLAAFYREKSAFRWLYLVASLLAIAGIILTASRAAWIGIIVIFAVLFLAAARSRQVLIIVCLGALVFSLLVATNSYWMRRFLTIFDFAVNSARINVYQVSISMMAKNFFGVGFGNFEEAHATYLTEEGAKPLAHAHNIFLYFGTELGPVALVLSTLIYCTAVYMCFRISRRKPYFLPVSAAMLAVVVRELFDATTSGLAMAGFLWFVFGLIFAEYVSLQKGVAEREQT